MISVLAIKLGTALQMKINLKLFNAVSHSGGADYEPDHVINLNVWC